MREFVYYSTKAVTSGDFDLSKLEDAGRMDIACKVVIDSFLLSHSLRSGVKLHLIFTGQPNPPVHLEFVYDEDLPISQKNIAQLIKEMLSNVRNNEKVPVSPGCYVEKKSFNSLLNGLEAENKNIYVLDKKGKDIRKLNNEDLQDAVFIIGDNSGLPMKEVKRIKNKISLGKKIYFANQTITIINSEMDYRGI
jgi:tRNA pseudouridine-54 N-methylase